MLTVAEEIFLLMLDSDSGRLNTGLPLPSVHNAVAGAMLMDLSLQHRIDTDLQHLFVVDRTPVEEPVSDQILQLITKAEDTKPTGFWLDVLAVDGEPLRAQLTGRLIEQGTLVEEADGRLTISGVADGGARRDPTRHAVRDRIARVVRGPGIPDPRDVMLISLANACSLWQVMVHDRVYAVLGTKIEQLAKMDLIGREVARILRSEGT